jgi:pimeloyl-ACP methyl ester carboxylesterase
MATVTIEEQALNYTRPNKTPAGPVLLLIHGAGGSHLDWPREIQRLPGFDVYNLDLPGHGRSPGPGRSSIGHYADIVAVFLELLDLREVTIAGHSMGGAIALTLALRQQPRLSKMIILNSGAKLSVAPALMETVLSNPKQAAETVVRMSWGVDMSQEVIKLGLHNMLQVDGQVLHGDFLACDQFDMRVYLDQIRTPTLIISGSEDQMTPERFGHFLVKGIAGAQLVIIEGTGHFSMMEKPQEVATVMTQFISFP